MKKVFDASYDYDGLYYLRHQYTSLGTATISSKVSTIQWHYRLDHVFIGSINKLFHSISFVATGYFRVCNTPNSNRPTLNLRHKLVEFIIISMNP